MSCSEFLNKCNQSQKTQDRFWNLLILATLNIAPDKAPASMLKVVLEQGFMSSRSDGASGLATIGLSELFGTLPQNFIEQHQGQVLVKSAVTDLIMEDQKVTGVIVNEQEKIYANHVIVTVPPNQLLKLIKKHKAFTQEKETLATMYSSPIVSLHLWTDQKLFDQAYVGFWDHDFHWAFRKQAFMEDTTIGHYTLVASGANHMVRMTTEQLTQKAYQALEPIGQSFTITRAKKSVMPHATWLFPLDSDCQPIDIQSTVSNLYFAGDWVDTGLPCTIESAVLSGHKAADLIVAKGL